jgi:hypothetical protein
MLLGRLLKGLLNFDEVLKNVCLDF